MSQIFGSIRQIAFVVDDIDEAMLYWSKTLGVGPFFIKRRIKFDSFIYQDKRCESPTVSIALSNSGDVQVELIQQHDDTPSIYQDFKAAGRDGLQHVSAWFTKKGFDVRKSTLLKQGVTIAQECTIPSSGVRLVYFATEQQHGGLIFEISDLMEPQHYERVQNIARQALKWGGEPVYLEVNT